MLEMLGMLIAASSGIAIPMAIARKAAQRELEKTVQDLALEVARLKESSKAWELLHAELRDLRDDVRTMTSAIARLEATLTRD